MKRLVFLCALVLYGCSSSLMPAQPSVPPPVPTFPMAFSTMAMSIRNFGVETIHTEVSGSYGRYETVKRDTSRWDQYGYDIMVTPSPTRFQYHRDTIILWATNPTVQAAEGDSIVMVLDTEARIIRSFKVRHSFETAGLAEVNNFAFTAVNLPYVPDSVGVHVAVTGAQLSDMVTGILESSSNGSSTKFTYQSQDDVTTYRSANQASLVTILFQR